MFVISTNEEKSLAAAAFRKDLGPERRSLTRTSDCPMTAFGDSGK
jgi:hypothetical protein